MSFPSEMIDDIKNNFFGPAKKATYLDVAIALGISEDTLRGIRKGFNTRKYASAIIQLHDEKVPSIYSPFVWRTYNKYVLAREMVGKEETDSTLFNNRFVQNELDQFILDYGDYMANSLHSSDITLADKGMLSLLLSLTHLRAGNLDDGIKYSLDCMSYYEESEYQNEDYGDFHSKALNNVAMAKLNSVKKELRRTDATLRAFLREFKILENYKNILNYLKLTKKDVIGLRNGLVVSEILAGKEIDDNLSLFHEALVELEPRWLNPEFVPVNSTSKLSVSKDPDLTYYFSKFFNKGVKS